MELRTYVIDWRCGLARGTTTVRATGLPFAINLFVAGWNVDPRYITGIRRGDDG